VASLDVRRSSELSDFERTMLWALLMEAFNGDVAREDWEHCLGGLHVIMSENDQPIAHAAVVARTLVAGGRPLSVGYVEGVATRSKWQKQGHGTEVMQAVGSIILRDYELGALATGRHGFFERLGWQRWRGATYVQSPSGRARTGEDDDAIMVLTTLHTYNLETNTALVCDWRPGDVW
jgi:aminoglycoside 2'-N-acetyltransferase I